MLRQLPKGWVKTTLGEIVRPGKQRVMPRDHIDLPYIGLEHIESQNMRLVGRGDAGSVRSSSILFEKGDVLYGKMRPYLNKVWVAEFAGMCSAEFLVFPRLEELNSSFLALRLNADDFVNFSNQQVSGERPRVDFKRISSFPIYLPPLIEQDRIVATLSESFSRMHGSELAAKRGVKRVGDYRAAVLHAAVSGELSREWRKAHRPGETGSRLRERLLRSRRTRWEKSELQRLRKVKKSPKDEVWKTRYPAPKIATIGNSPKSPSGWIWASIDQVASGAPGSIQSGPFGSQLLHSEFVDKGVLAIGIDNVLDGEFSLGQGHRITAAKYEQLKKFTARPFDVVITVMGTVGRVCVLPEDLEKAIITKHCYRISPAQDFVNSDYLSLTLRANAQTRKHIMGNIRGQTRAGINGSILKVSPVPLPPLKEQDEIVRQVKYRLSAADRLLVTLGRQVDRARVTRQALLREAFSGQLVAQDPKDEPASILLDRIHATREAETRKPKANSMRKTKMKLSRRRLLDVLREQKKPITPEKLFRDAGFQVAEVDLFYRELASLRTVLRETKPSALEAKGWPARAHIFLELKEG